MKSILIANRGEIAVRIEKTAKRLGYRTIAVYAEPDADAPHVSMADDAILIGPAAASDSYLSGPNILDAAERSGADAIHPGYGFLSENANFAASCEQAGITFIGPSPRAIELMGDKAAARQHMEQAGVRCVPGFDGDQQSDDALAAAAANIGYPVMIKAAAGGGGRGMRLVHSAAELADALALARAEALGAFGADRLIIEKAIERPRHVEVQVFSDQHGNVLHLGERDCSVQRRHQKIIEEAPCPVVTDELRERMGATAVAAARSISYVGAGTVEFLLDESGEFYFLEMNTRLQVEHPVTEMITGLDLVEWQIDVALGKTLPLQQEQVDFSGHAIEVRLYAEDPARDFVPSTGRVLYWQEPGGEGIRVDSGIANGQFVSPWYDPLLAKIVACGNSRAAALERLRAALEDTVLFGPVTNRDFLLQVLTDKQFAAGDANTAFIGESDSAKSAAKSSAVLRNVAAALIDREMTIRAMSASVRVAPELLHWSSTGPLSRELRLLEGDELHKLHITGLADGTCELDGERVEILQHDGNAARIRHGSTATDCTYLLQGDQLHIATSGETRSFRIPDGSLTGDDEAASGRVLAPMHGLVVELFVSEGDTVNSGDKLAILEAMKMQHEIRANVDGVISQLHCSKSTQIEANAIMLDIETKQLIDRSNQ